jgi:superfamily II DNA or RNA helicase
MKKSFEDRLIDASGKDTLKRAKLLLKSASPVCAWRSERGKVCHAVFTVAERNLYVSTAALGYSGDCECGKCSEDHLCEHAVAAKLYFTRFTPPAIPEISADAAYAGMRGRDFEELVKALPTEPGARLKIEAASDFIHVPSKWENALLKIKLCQGSREYTGNINNLRSLFFDKTLSVTLKYHDFPPLERQIIRYLALNGVPEKSMVMLNSEQTAELFHSMHGFKSFYREGRAVVVRREPAELVLTAADHGDQMRMEPALLAGESLLELDKARVIIGRTGLWAGIDNEYWWVPAAAEINWMRSFIRLKPFMANTDSFANIFGARRLPVRIIRRAPEKPKAGKCIPVYSAMLTAEGSFHLQIKFDYGNGQFCNPDGGRFIVDAPKAVQRNELAERNYVEELRCFGFKLEDGEMPGFFGFVIKDNLEAVGTFLDRLVAEWQREGRVFRLDSRLALLAGGGLGVQEINLKCPRAVELNDSFEISYSITAGKASIAWQDAATAAREHRKYVKSAGGKMLAIPEQLGRFMRGISGVLRRVDPQAGVLEIPRQTIHFWLNMAKEMPHVCPPELGPYMFFTQKNAGIIAPPVRTNRFKGKLRDYQREGVAWLEQLSARGFNPVLADEMGLGKTIQALALLSRSTAGDRPSLLVCPTSLTDNWQREAKRFVPKLKVSIIRGPRRKKQWLDAKSDNLLITSYAIIRRDLATLKEMQFDYLILDEAQHIKNPATANARACKSVAARRRLVLTGTPLENSPEDLWSILDFLEPGLLGGRTAFRDYYAEIHNSRELQDDLVSRVGPLILRRTKKEVCKELPPKMEHTIFCEMESDQRKLYDELLEYGRKQCGKLMKNGKKGAGIELLTTLLRLRQTCCDPALLPDNIGAKVSSAKGELLRELIMENTDSEHKMLLFSQFTSQLALVRTWLDGNGIVYEYLDGSTRNRLDKVDNFNENQDISLFLLSLKAGGTGLNLTSADTVIIYDPWWNPAVELQAADRTHRIGQTRPVNIMKLVVKDSIEERILQMQQHKQKIFDALIENPAAGRKISLDEIKFLLDA